MNFKKSFKFMPLVMLAFVISFSSCSKDELTKDDVVAAISESHRGGAFVDNSKIYGTWEASVTNDSVMQHDSTGTKMVKHTVIKKYVFGEDDIILVTEIETMDGKVVEPIVNPNAEPIEPETFKLKYSGNGEYYGVITSQKIKGTDSYTENGFSVEFVGEQLKIKNYNSFGNGETYSYYSKK